MYASILSLRTPNLNRVGIRNPIKLLQDAKLTLVRPPGGVVRAGLEVYRSLIEMGSW